MNKPSMLVILSPFAFLLRTALRAEVMSLRLATVPEDARSALECGSLLPHSRALRRPQKVLFPVPKCRRQESDRTNKLGM